MAEADLDRKQRDRMGTPVFQRTVEVGVCIMAVLFMGVRFMIVVFDSDIVMFR